ncbi:hypothetical protein, partial [Mesorhizobium sp. M8A.F.Ca.ET.182.01.1.1]|uniref:hypothetical protein n=1 Tax=Mesorhizobium sp. M8A.F.Ca.ET.182.01.1.1 TaxID=2563964 RepID=UPI001AED26AE
MQQIGGPCADFLLKILQGLQVGTDIDALAREAHFLVKLVDSNFRGLQFCIFKLYRIGDVLANSE